jgi:hypothetical protein
MYRMLVMYPTSADPGLVDDIVERTATVFKQRSGFHSVTTSVDALMGPGARAGEVSRILEADFTTLDDALAALHDDAFKEVKSITESLGTRLFLYAFSDL